MSEATAVGLAPPLEDYRVLPLPARLAGTSVSQPKVAAHDNCPKVLSQQETSMPFQDPSHLGSDRAGAARVSVPKARARFLTILRTQQLHAHPCAHFPGVSRFTPLRSHNRQDMATCVFASDPYEQVAHSRRNCPRVRGPHVNPVCPPHR